MGHTRSVQSMLWLQLHDAAHARAHACIHSRIQLDHVAWLYDQDSVGTKNRERRGRTQTLRYGLLHLTFGHAFNRGLGSLRLPRGLLDLTFGDDFNQRFDITLPGKLRSLTFGRAFDQSLDEVSLPSSLRRLTFGTAFGQGTDRIALPEELSDLVISDANRKNLNIIPEHYFICHFVSKINIDEFFPVQMNTTTRTFTCSDKQTILGARKVLS